VNNIKMDVRGIGWGDIDWIDMAQDRVQWKALVNTVMKLRVPSHVGKFLSSCTTGGLTRRTQLHAVSLLEVSYFTVLESLLLSRACKSQVRYYRASL
jgi:hypothetical protein